MAATVAWKCWYIKRDTIPELVAQGDTTEYIVEAALQLYTGDETTEMEYDPNMDAVVPVTRFRLLERLTGAKIPRKYKPYVSFQDGAGFDVVVIRRGDLNINIVSTEELTQRLVALLS